jgi:tol-pal system protein YbgF
LRQAFVNNPSVTIWTQEFAILTQVSDHIVKPMARFATCAITLSALALMATCAALASARAQDSQRSPGFFDRIFTGSERFGASEVSPAVGERMAQLSDSDLLVRLDRLEAQIRQLTGMVEQLQYRNQQLEAQLRGVQPDSERRVGEPGVRAPARTPPPRAESVMPPRVETLPPPSPPPPAATPGRRGDAFDPSQHPNAPGAPHTLGTMSTGGAVGETPIGAPGARAAGAPYDLATAAPPGPAPRYPNPGGAAAATLPPSQTPRDEFDLGYGYMLRKDYALAEDTLRAFLSKYPSDPLAGEATFWLGESLFQRQRFRDAAEAFLNVTTKHDTAAKASDALLRLGQSLAALGEKEAACASLGEVLRKFPRASSAVKQGVEREQKRVRC